MFCVSLTDFVCLLFVYYEQRFWHKRVWVSHCSFEFLICLIVFPNRLVDKVGKGIILQRMCLSLISMTGGPPNLVCSFVILICLFVCFCSRQSRQRYHLAKERSGSDPYDWELPALVCSWHQLLTGGNNTLISRSIRTHHREIVNGSFCLFVFCTLIIQYFLVRTWWLPCPES